MTVKAQKKRKNTLTEATIHKYKSFIFFRRWSSTRNKVKKDLVLIKGKKETENRFRIDWWGLFCIVSLGRSIIIVIDVDKHFPTCRLCQQILPNRRYISFIRLAKVTSTSLVKIYEWEIELRILLIYSSTIKFMFSICLCASQLPNKEEKRNKMIFLICIFFHIKNISIFIVWVVFVCTRTKVELFNQLNFDQDLLLHFSFLFSLLWFGWAKRRRQIIVGILFWHCKHETSSNLNKRRLTERVKEISIVCSRKLSFQKNKESYEKINRFRCVLFLIHSFCWTR